MEQQPVSELQIINIFLDYFRNLLFAIIFVDEETTVHLMIPNEAKMTGAPLKLEVVPSGDSAASGTPLTLNGLKAKFKPPGEKFNFRLTGKTNTGSVFQVNCMAATNFQRGARGNVMGDYLFWP